MSDRALELAYASLSILELLIRQLQKQGILSEREIAGLLEDAREAHRNSSDRDNAVFHANVAEIIDVLRKGDDVGQRGDLIELHYKKNV